jgi:outer membrane protein TolC
MSLEYTWGDGGRRRSQLESAQFRYDATLAQLTDAQKALQADIDAMLIRLSAIDSSIPLLQEKLALSLSEAETSRSQLMTGQANLRQLVEAEIEIYRAQDEQIAMRAERQILLLTIAARAGALAGLIGLQE